MNEISIPKENNLAGLAVDAAQRFETGHEISRLANEKMPIAGKSSLGNPESLRAVIAEIEAAAMPSPTQTEKLCAYLWEAYPSQHKAEVNRETWALFIIKELEAVPFVCAMTAVHDLIRNSKFMPAVAEVKDACEAQVGKLRLAKYRAKQELKEHERRESDRLFRERIEADRVKLNGKSLLQAALENGAENVG